MASSQTRNDGGITAEVMLLPLDFQLHLRRRWPADLDNVSDGESGLARNPRATCTRSSHVADDLDWHTCLLWLGCRALRPALRKTYGRAHPWHFPWQSAQSVIRLSIASPP